MDNFGHNVAHLCQYDVDLKQHCQEVPSVEKNFKYTHNLR